MSTPESACGVCKTHSDIDAIHKYEICRNQLWVLRHHPNPAPKVGWLLLDSLRHLGGPVDFQPEEASAWGLALQNASKLVKQLTLCNRVYSISFGEGARHLHLHLIPHYNTDSEGKAWQVADLYRNISSGKEIAGNPEEIESLVRQAKLLNFTFN